MDMNSELMDGMFNEMDGGIEDEVDDEVNKALFEVAGMTMQGIDALKK